MKAQRRHELKENSLVNSLRKLPGAGQQLGSRIALVVVILLLIGVLIQYKVNSVRERHAEAQRDLSQANQLLQDLKQMQGDQSTDPQSLATQRQSTFDQASALVDAALENAGDSQAALKAQALVCRGDLNFALANLNPVPGAATQPSLQPQQPVAQLLSSAADAYNQVLQSYANQAFPVTAARFGLAAVAEDRAVQPGADAAVQWEDARQQYTAILNSDAARPFRDLATYRLQLLSQIQQPVLTGLEPPTRASSTTQASATRTSATQLGPMPPVIKQATATRVSTTRPSATRPSPLSPKLPTSR